MDNDLLKTVAKYFNTKDIIAVYLFGSYAEGRERPSSDIDIGVLLNEKNNDLEKNIQNTFIVELSRIIKKDIHLIILNSASEELMRQIFLKGKCILVNDKKRLAIFEMVALSKIAEFAYYRNQMQKGLIKKVMGE
jgi:uncharacterized protein